MAPRKLPEIPKTEKKIRKLPKVPLAQSSANNSSNPSNAQDFDADLNLFNYVSDNSNLTYQNVDFLLKNALQKMGISQEEKDELFRKQFLMTAISDDQSLDFSLQDAILTFLGQDPKQDKFSILMCSGMLNEDGQIEGNSHWTALHLRREGNKIKVYHLNSSSNSIPEAVFRVIDGIKNINADDLAQRDHGTLSDLKIRAIEELANVDFEKPIVVSCNPQKDGYSCGYHAVFNALSVHFCEDVATSQNILLQDNHQVENEDFIALHKVELQDHFNGVIDFSTLKEAQKIVEYIKNIEKEKPQNYDQIFTDYNFALRVRDAVIVDSSETIEKLICLYEIEKQFNEFAKNNPLQSDEIATILSSLELQKFSKKLMAAIVEELSIFRDQSLDDEKYNHLLKALNQPSIINNLNDDIIEALVKFYLDINKENFDELAQEIGLQLKPLNMQLYPIKEEDELSSPSTTPNFSRQNSTAAVSRVSSSDSSYYEIV